MALSSLWQRFERYLLEYRQLGFSLDISRIKFPDDADPEDVFHLLWHLANNDARIKVTASDEPADDQFFDRRIQVVVPL